MQSFDELMSMDDTQLRALAESMGMKKSHTDNKEEMAYYVIDNASAQVAKEEAAKIKPRPSRERKPRVKKTDKTANGESVEDAATAPEAAAEARPKKRGRKPKVAEETAEELKTTDSEPAVTPAQQAPVKAKPGRKPGRKPKNEEPKEEQASALLPALVASQEESFREKVSDNAGSSVPENPAETEDGTQDIADVGGMSEATVEREERPVQKEFRNRQLPQPGTKPSLGSFFTSAKGRTFTPRSQQQIHEAAVAAAQAPIIIAEPSVAQVQAAARQQKHLTKKQRQQQRQFQIDLALRHPVPMASVILASVSGIDGYPRPVLLLGQHEHVIRVHADRFPQHLLWQLLLSRLRFLLGREGVDTLANQHRADFPQAGGRQKENGQEHPQSHQPLLPVLPRPPVMRPDPDQPHLLRISSSAASSCHTASPSSF